MTKEARDLAFRGLYVFTFNMVSNYIRFTGIRQLDLIVSVHAPCVTPGFRPGMTDLMGKTDSRYFLYKNCLTKSFNPTNLVGKRA